MAEARENRWNRSSTDGAEACATHGKHPFIHGISASLVVVAGVGISLYILRGTDERAAPGVVPAKTGLIGAQRPAENPKPNPKPKEEKKDGKDAAIDPDARPTKVGEVVNGYVMLPSGRIHRRLGVVTNSAASRPKGAYHIFESPTDNEIACYLTLKPGETLIGTPRYDGRFKRQFLESLKTPIVVTADDTPEQAKLKREVVQARAELKAALDRGEDIEQIMLDTRQELQDLMRYKMEIKSMFNDARLKSCETEQDVEDLLTACNKMLESKGIAPMKFGPITRCKLMSQNQEGSDK